MLGEEAVAKLIAQPPDTPRGRRDAAVIGFITNDSRHVVLETELGGTRLLDELEDDPLPRIC